MKLSFVFLGLSITSSWGNGHATTYRGLLCELARAGHKVTFLENDLPFYAQNRDLPTPPFCALGLYGSLEELRDRFTRTVRDADVVIVGSYVPNGVAVGDWVLSESHGVRAFYDIDTPVTMRDVTHGRSQYLQARQVRRYELYLSFTGGPLLEKLERDLGSPCARPLYCGVDPELYFPEPQETLWDLGYLGTFSVDRQIALERLLVAPATAWKGGRFVVAGAQYPNGLLWPDNAQRIVHVPPREHRSFYNAQRFTLNVTRADMLRAGYSPSVRLFEAAACGVPILTDRWTGLERFFEPEREIIVVDGTGDVLAELRSKNDERCSHIRTRARQRVLAEHTAAHRAEKLEEYVRPLLPARRRGQGRHTTCEV